MSSLAISGRLRPAAINFRISRSRAVNTGASPVERRRISETKPAATSDGTTFLPAAHATTASTICSRRDSLDRKPEAPDSSAV